METAVVSDIIENVDIIDIASESRAVAKIDDYVIFVKHAVPGDVVDIEIIKKKKKFAEAKIVNIKKSSPLRVQSFCEHFGICGGCKWQHLSYEAQITYKQRQVEETLKRIGKTE